MKPDNVRGIPLIGTPAVWQSLGLHGEGVKIAIIDTGIDYTHANFGGPGTAAAYTAAHARADDGTPADPSLFGPSAPRIKGGIDFVGDSYNPDPRNPLTYQPIPHPDPNPLDCNGHGSHVAGTAAGSGVTSAAMTYTGPYNAATLAAPGNFNIGPGVAPKADLYAVRVFGCEGPTDVTVDAIEWAVDNDMDVINMSLGSTFGSKDDPSAVGANTIAVVTRVTCARVAKAIFGQQAGAAAVVMVNTSSAFPPFEGPITSNPDDGKPFNVTIPFLGIRSTDGAALLAADGANMAA